MTTQTDELTETGKDKIKTAEAIEELARDLRNADSIAEDVPVLADLFHEARTSQRSSYDGKYVSLLDYDPDADEWTCRSTAWLESGTHYMNHGATVCTGFPPRPFMSVDEFAEHKAATLEQEAQRTRQRAWNHRKEPDVPDRGL